MSDGGHIIKLLNKADIECCRGDVAEFKRALFERAAKIHTDPARPIGRDS